MSYFEELKRRNVFRVGIAYGVAAWVLLQVADLVLEAIEAPGWVLKALLLVVALGFVAALVVAWAYELTPEGIRREKDVDRSRSVTSQTGRKLDRIIIAFLVLAVVVLLYRQFTSSVPQTESDQTQLAGDQVVEPAARDRSIAVLPFVNMSEDASNEYFADGVSEEILNSLAQVSELKVAGRTSSFAFKGQNQDLRKIGETLGVENILEGSVRKAGNRVRITAQLVKAEDGFHLWSETYDRELTDVFAIQDEIASAILEEMKAALIGDNKPVSRKTDVQAYELFLQARQLLRERTPDTIESSRELFSKVIELDRNYAPAYAQSAIATLLLSDSPESYGDIPVAVAHASATRLIDQALALDPDLAEAYAARGLLSLNTKDYDAGVEAVDRALAINPGLIDAINWKNLLIRRQGRLREAARLLGDLNIRDPLYRPAYNNLMDLYTAFGDEVKAQALLGKMSRVLPGDWQLKMMESQVQLVHGDLAHLVKSRHSLAEEYPDPLSSYLRFFESLGWFFAGDYEAALELNTVEPGTRINTLGRLGRYEEAKILGEQHVASGQYIDAFIQMLYDSEKYDDIVEFVDTRWDHTRDIEKSVDLYDGYGSSVLATIAYSYRHAGRDEAFAETMAFYKEALEKQVNEGADNWRLDGSRALFESLSGNDEEALELAVKSINSPFVEDPRWVEKEPIFAGLRSEPRFQAAIGNLRKRFNQERTKLGLEPIGESG